MIGMKSMAPKVPSAPPSAGQRWVRAGALLVGIVAAVFFIGRLASKKVRDLTPEELRLRMEGETLRVETAIEQINRLDARDRREVMQSPQAQAYFQRLPADQRMRLVRETLDRGIQQQIDSFRKMKPDERAKFVEEARARQQEARERMQNMPESDKQNIRQMMSSGKMDEVIDRAMHEYLAVTSSEERVQLAPLFDGALDNLNFAKKL